MLTDNFVIFRNYPVRGYWEISGCLYTTYLMHEMILSEDKFAADFMLTLHGITDTESVVETLVKYTQDPQEEMFIVEIKPEK